MKRSSVPQKRISQMSVALEPRVSNKDYGSRNYADWHSSRNPTQQIPVQNIKYATPQISPKGVKDVKNDFVRKSTVKLEDKPEIEVLVKQKTKVYKADDPPKIKKEEEEEPKIVSELVSELGSDGSELFYREYDIDEVEKSIAVIYQRAQGSGLISQHLKLMTSIIGLYC